MSEEAHFWQFSQNSEQVRLIQFFRKKNEKNPKMYSKSCSVEQEESKMYENFSNIKPASNKLVLSRLKLCICMDTTYT